MTLDLPAAWLRRRVEAAFLCQVPTRIPLVGLTFDDGPDPDATPRVLELLRRGGHTATFFCIGRNAARHPAVVTAAAAAGHEIGNHTYTHPPLTLVPRRRLVEEIRRAHWVLASLSGGTPLHFRPPLGWATPAVLRQVTAEGYRTVLGTVYPSDPHAPDADTIVRRTVARLAPGRIVILHDGTSRGRSRERTLEALPEILAQVEARGLRGVSVRELLAASQKVAGLAVPSGGRASAALGGDTPPAGARGSRS